MTKQIPLTRGQHALVDDVDYQRVMQHKWFAHYNKSNKAFYAKRGVGGHMQTLAGFVVNAPIGTVVDHINHDTLDNRRSNLRVVTRAENGRNQKPRMYATTGRGVCYIPERQRWRATFTVNGKRLQRRFMTEAQAVAQREAWEREFT
jgi:hypothetical protein